ncbi:MAG: DoxX family membrane protein [Rhodanobacter sp.]|nr:MAG: DoxX family membrane protein [Rhodanobacter sp.]
MGTGKRETAMQTNNTTQANEWTPARFFAFAGLMALGVRLVQGWVYWGGASRRMFYDFHMVHGHLSAVKLNPDVGGYLANKLIHAMPGSVFPDLIQWILLHGSFLHFMVWFWTLVELVVGVGLIIGFATRLLAFASVGLNVSLMMIFGWMGSTCVDEWTMAAAGFAMGTVLMLTGGGSWSVDQWLARRNPEMGERGWFRVLFSGHLPYEATRKWSIWLGIISIVFTVGSYQYLHGAVFSPLHGRVNFHHYHLSMDNAQAKPDGTVSFHAYVDAGPDTGKLYLIGATLLDTSGKTVEQWSGKQLTALPKASIVNRFTMPWASQFKPTAYGIGGVTGAKATLQLPGSAAQALTGTGYTLRLDTIDGKHWNTTVKVQP